MATAIQRQAQMVKTISGNSPWTLSFPEAASQTFKKGALVTIDASGNVVECVSPTPIRILGIALEDASNLAAISTFSNLGIAVANMDTLFAFNLVAGQVTAKTDLGGRYGVVKNASSPSNWQIDKTVIAAGGATRVIVTGFDATHGDNIGDSGGRLIARFFSSNTLLSGTSPFV